MPLPLSEKIPRADTEAQLVSSGHTDRAWCLRSLLRPQGAVACPSASGRARAGGQYSAVQCSAVQCSAVPGAAPANPNPNPTEIPLGSRGRGFVSCKEDGIVIPAEAHR